MALQLPTETTPRAYRHEDRDAVLQSLAQPLSQQYPGGASWLRSRLRDVDAGAARCHVHIDGDALVGVAIETPKGPQRLKLSTLWVAPDARERGFGSALARHCVAGWRREGIERVHITASEEALPGVAAILEPLGFRPAAVETDRYGPGRHETVLVWTP